MHLELWPQFSDFARFLCAFALKISQKNVGDYQSRSYKISSPEIEDILLPHSSVSGVCYIAVG